MAMLLSIPKSFTFLCWLVPKWIIYLVAGSGERSCVYPVAHFSCLQRPQWLQYIMYSIAYHCASSTGTGLAIAFESSGATTKPIRVVQWEESCIINITGAQFAKRCDCSQQPISWTGEHSGLIENEWQNAAFSPQHSTFDGPYSRK